MKLFAAGISHKTAPVESHVSELIERLNAQRQRHYRGELVGASSRPALAPGTAERLFPREFADDANLLLKPAKTDELCPCAS